jgi:glutathione peroxidase
MLKVCFLILTLSALASSIYNFKIAAIDGSEIELSKYQGKKILFVNTATQSRFAGQLRSLEKLYQKYKDSLVIVAVPSKSFGNEPAAASEIKTHLQDQYGAHYLIAAPLDVSGPNTTPLYQWLTSKANNGVMSSSVEGDFQKYLINSDGRLIGYFIPGVDPMDSIVLKSIENKVLAK